MYKHILIPTDGSDVATQAVDQAIQLAKALGARVTFLNVVEPFYPFSIDAEQLESSRVGYEKHAAAQARKLLDAATEKASAAGVACEGVHQTSDQPYEAIIASALGRGCDLIAMASHGRGGIAAILLGSETTKVLTHSKVPVLVYR